MLTTSNRPWGKSFQRKRRTTAEALSLKQDFNPRPVTEVQSASPNHIEAALRDVHMRAPNLQLLIVILPDVTGHYDVPTIIFGADFIHPTAEDSSAFIAAVVASMDWPQVTTYKVLASAQTHREEMIQNLFWTGTDAEKGTPVNGRTISC
ncbi:protein argonaute 5-like isoform X2 [Miscanthus floridulus]|uniref:protein argonaute 5-like isoform X2 n=1 Tax=Miscanthus floridulus TaxID=154761 RepID=UPI0034586033